MTGNWKVNVSTKFPQPIATTLSEMKDTLIGADYTPIAYLGEQVVNGTNHAVLAEQTILTGKDTKNIVLLIFNVKPTQVGGATLVSIERIVEGNNALGGTEVWVDMVLDDDDMAIWDEAFEGFVGSNVAPIAAVGCQMANGMNYLYLATITPVAPEAETRVVLVTINAMLKKVSIADILNNKQQASLGYAFTW